MEYLNLKAFFLSVILLVFTYKFYVRTPGSFMSLGAVIAVGIAAAILFLAYFFGIKLIGYFITSEKFYPHVFINILWPFVVLSFAGWLVYGAIYIKPFGYSSDFFNLMKTFVSKHMLFVAICTIVIGLTLSFPHVKGKIANELLLKKNVWYLVLTFGAFLLSIGMFYFVKKIKQPTLNVAYSFYKSLDENTSAKNYTVEQLLVASEYNFVAEPYILTNKNELIIITHFRSSNTDEPIEKIYRIDKEGKIIEILEEGEVVNNEDISFFPLICKGGILTDYSGKKLISWVFDGSKKKQDVKTFEFKSDWKIDTLKQNATAINMVHFYKTSDFHCNNIDEVKYNGNKYYEVHNGKEILKFRVDSVFSHHDNIENCDEKKLEYYEPAGFNFSLLRLNEHDYYIIKPKNN